MGIGAGLKGLRKKLAATFNEPNASAAPGLEASGPGLGLTLDAASAGWPRELLHPDTEETSDD